MMPLGSMCDRSDETCEVRTEHPRYFQGKTSFESIVCEVPAFAFTPGVERAFGSAVRLVIGNGT